MKAQTNLIILFIMLFVSGQVAFSSNLLQENDILAAKLTCENCTISNDCSQMRGEKKATGNFSITFFETNQNCSNTNKKPSEPFGSNSNFFLQDNYYSINFNLANFAHKSTILFPIYIQICCLRL